MSRSLLPAALLLLAAAGTCALGGPISVSEIHYNPSTDGSEEFIELINASTSSFNLAGCRFTSGITYTFADGVLAPGQRVVICRDRTRFTARYGSIGNLATGNYSGALSDDGETVAFATSGGTELFSVRFRPDGDWPSRADGLGSSLESVDPNGDLNDPANWRSSAEFHGSPGVAGVGPQRRVLINEVLAHADPPLEDAIELVNTTDAPIDIGGWYLSDSRANPTRYRIPSPRVIPAKGYTVFYQYQFDSLSPSPGDVPFGFASATGDEAVLVAADANGTPRLWMDAVTFGATANGVSLGRHPDASGSLTTLSRVTLGTSIAAGDNPLLLNEFRKGTGASNAAPFVGPIVFNRIQYHPATGNDEFVEIINATDSEQPLYDPAFPENRWIIGGGIGYTFNRPLSLAPGEKLLVVPIDPAAFRLKYGLSAAVRIEGPYTNALSNTGERIALLRPDPPELPPSPDAGLVPYILVDEIRYLSTAPWPIGAAGTGIAIRRRDPKAFGDDPTAWKLDLPDQTPSLTTDWNGTVLTLRWTADASGSLVLESAADPTSGTWNLVDTLAPGTSSRTVTTLDSERFYRLRRP